MGSICNEKKLLCLSKANYFKIRDNSDDTPWYENEDIHNLTRISNANGIFSVRAYSFKIDNSGKHIYVARENSIRDYKKLYNSLKEKTEVQGDMYKFSTDYDILDMLENVGLPTGDGQQLRILC